MAQNLKIWKEFKLQNQKVCYLQVHNDLVKYDTPTNTSIKNVIILF